MKVRSGREGLNEGAFGDSRARATGANTCSAARRRAGQDEPAGKERSGSQFAREAGGRIWGVRWRVEGEKGARRPMLEQQLAGGGGRRERSAAGADSREPK